MVEAGKLNQRWTLEEPVSTTNELGEVVQSWQPVAEVWANIRPLRTADVIRARAAQLETTHAVTIRYRDDINGTWRLTRTKSDGSQRTLNIVGQPIDVDERHEALEMQCVEVGSRG